MRTYLIMKEKAARWNADREIQQLLDALRARGAGSSTERVSFSAERASQLKAQTLDLPSIRAQGYGYERLDQLTMELLLGVR